tara:strand:+ start:2310 stop:2555 length:246 start_codon:yes stop_codon:yes gene_type:complete
MTGTKYSICKTKTGKTKKEIIEGKKKVCYKKKGSSKMYVKSKGKMMGLSKYKKVIMNMIMKMKMKMKKAVGISRKKRRSKH